MDKPKSEHLQTRPASPNRIDDLVNTGPMDYASIALQGKDGQLEK